MDRDLDDEIASHLAEARDEYIQRGLSAEDAHLAALRGFGGVTQSKEVYRQVRSFMWLDALTRDVRHGLRRLTREPGFAATAILILAVGIGSCTAMFSIVQTVLLRPFGVDAPHSLVMLWTQQTQRSAVELPYKAYRDLRAYSRSFDNVAIVGSVNWPGTLTIGDAEPLRLPSSVVSASFFDVLGAPPLLGRTFRDDDDQPAAPRVLVLSHPVWVQHFGGDPSVIGRRVAVREETPAEPFEIIGVMPEDFFFPRGAGYWTPAAPRLARIARRAGGRLEPFFNDLNVFYGLGRITVSLPSELAGSDRSV